MSNLQEKFQELAKASKTFGEKYQSKADFGECPDNVRCFIEDMGYAIRSLQYQLDWMSETFFEHLKGHLPAVKSVEQLKRAVDVLGLNEEYDVEKKTLYARRNNTFVIG